MRHRTSGSFGGLLAALLAAGSLATALAGAPAAAAGEKGPLATLLRDDADLAASDTAGLKAKFAAMAESPYAFLRGTAILFYTDRVGRKSAFDTAPPVVLAGDLHADNFGSFEAGDREIEFGVSDGDDAFVGPFALDLERLSLSLVVARFGFDGKKDDERRSIVRAVAAGYRKGLEEARDHGRRSEKLRLRPGNSEHAIGALLDHAKRRDEDHQLSKWTRVDDGKRRFVRDLSLQDVDATFAKAFPKIVADYRKGLTKDAPDEKDYFDVKDVCARVDAGVGSRGRDREYILIEGKKDGPKNDRILEAKVERDPAAVRAGYARATGMSEAGARRVVRAFRTLHLSPDRFLGDGTIGGRPVLIRELSAYKDRVDLAKISRFKDYLDHAFDLGRATAIAHAHSQTPERILGFAGLRESVVEGHLAKTIEGDLDTLRKGFEALKPWIEKH